ncbi:MAG: 5'/3'-nucleotidase SurE [Anaerolineae bacterium]|jgi:5'-nucleotidase|nr:5'/3'-nucleotidase SurE [Anaerolineae bacterium]PKO02744.1 MAG: 5'/3'-nucleotidase SurE [Chloroflexi bacterium HGW-Chloroflexi-5]
MHILVTNDDGVMAPGLLALVIEMRKVGDVSVLAPDRNWSAAGHVKTLHRPLRAKPVTLLDGSSALASDGAPSDCVALALMGVIEKPVDLVVSGINPNANIGHDITYSGTVTAAMEAVINGVPGVAVSLDAPEHNRGTLDYGPAAAAARKVVETLIKQPFSRDILLNVNVPYLPEDEIKGFRPTRQGLRIYRDELIRREDPRGKPYYWIGGEAPTGVDESGTDFGDLKAGYVSISPIQLDMTAYKVMEEIIGWEWPAK